MPHLGYVVVALLGFGFIIFIHELGHFVAAKLFGVKVTAFSIGYPPTVLHKQFGDTDYRLSLIPLGGYCSMLGEDPDDEEAATDPRALHNAKPWKRTVIFLGGVTLNVVSAMVIYVAASVVGIEAVAPVVGAVRSPSPAEAAGLRPGDRIEAIDGEEVRSFEDVRKRVAIGGLGNPDRKLRVKLEGRDEPRRVASIRTGSDIPILGIEPPLEPRIMEIKAGAPAEQAGLREGDRIVELDGEPIRFMNTCLEALERKPAGPLSLTVEREGERVQLRIDPEEVTAPDYGLVSLPQIQEVRPNSPAEEAGLKGGDIIVSINGKRHPSGDDVSDAIQGHVGRPVPIKVRRDGETMSLEVTPRRDEFLGYDSIGIIYDSLADPPAVWFFGRKTAAQEAGIPNGAEILKIDGERTRDWGAIRHALFEADGEPVEITYQAPGAKEEATVRVTPRESWPDIFFVGTTLAGPIREKLPPIYNPVKALGLGFNEIASVVELQWVTVKGLFSGTVSRKSLSSPLGIGIAFYKTAQAGVAKFMTFLGMVSVAIALLNAMPFPPLDGGHVVFVALEKILRKPVPAKVRSVLSAVGAVLLLGLVAMAFAADISRFIL